MKKLLLRTGSVLLVSVPVSMLVAIWTGDVRWALTGIVACLAGIYTWGLGKGTL